MHSARVEHIDTDAQGRYVVTGSHDKTIRIWSSKDGALLRTIRPPIGAGHEGKIFAVAISPDGRYIAAGGWSGGTWEGQNSIYLFERESGQLLRRLGSLPSILYNLKFSPDGSRLVALLRSGGIRVFQAGSGLEVSADRDYKDSATGVDFDRSGRLVTSGLDGYIRLYDSSLKRLKKESTGSAQPYSVRFSPDGQRVAVGYEDLMRVDLLSGQDLTPLSRPEVTGLRGSELSVVAWSANGSRLCAGGRGPVQQTTTIRCWNMNRLSTYLDTELAGHAVYDLAALPDGRWIFSAKNPGWGLLNEQGRLIWSAESTSADFGDSAARFLVNQTGDQVQFGYGPKGPASAWFSVAKRSLSATADPQPDDSLRAAITTAPTLALTGWQGTSTVKLNGQLLRLPAYEQANTLSISPSRTWFVLGTERYLRCYDSTGHERWQAAVPGETQQVNISGDGKLAVAAFGDGTIRWYRAEDGTELLALFPHADRKRWIAWTPAGFYDASPDGEDLMGWHVNRGLSAAADFFPASRFRDRFRRPDRIAESLRVEHREAPTVLPRKALSCVALGIPVGFSAFQIEFRSTPEGRGRLATEVLSLLTGLGVASTCR